MAWTGGLLMARIRTIKPEFWSSPDTAACEDPWARLLFIAMWNWADDAGRGTANPKELGGFAFPNDEKIDSAEIRRMLGEIRRAFGVTFYMIGGRPYYAIPSWEKHQKIDKRSGPKYPAPEDGEDWDPDPNGLSDQRKRHTSENPAEPSGEPAESTTSIRRVLGAGTGEQGNRGSKTTPNGVGATAPLIDPPAKITPHAVVGVWVEAMKANDVTPTQGMRNQVGKLAKELLGSNDADRVLDAARQAGAKGFATIDRELAALAGRPLRVVNGRPVAGDGVIRDPRTGVAVER